MQYEKCLLDSDGNPIDRISGFETEYGITFNGEAIPRYDYDYDEESGIESPVFRTYALLENGREMITTGDRQYLDLGMHPEISTAEETIFLHAVYRKFAGHVRMARIAADFNEHEFSYSVATVMANTIGASPWQSWGSHENILAPRALEFCDYVKALLVHNVSRVVWSGTGYVQLSHSGDGFDYHLSERAHLIQNEEGLETINGRPLVNTRDEALADRKRFRRIHLITGETGFAPVAQALRLASLSIILRACEAGVEFDDLLPEYPVLAIHMFSRDPTLKQKVRLQNGREMTAIEMQEAILQRSVEGIKKKRSGYLTPQETEWVGIWSELLNDLKLDPQLAADRVDWVRKLNSIHRALDRKDKGQKANVVAQNKAFRYHQLFPIEGEGMRLLRAGWFAMAPTAEQLDHGLPPAHRAAVRVAAIMALEQAGANVYADWEGIRPYGDRHTDASSLYLGDPFSNDMNRLGNYLGQTGIRL